MCDRSSDPTEHDAARERPSTLDVETLADAMEGSPGVAWPATWHRGDFEWVARQVGARYARLTEPDAGEGCAAFVPERLYRPFICDCSACSHPDDGPCSHCGGTDHYPAVQPEPCGEPVALYGVPYGEQYDPCTKPKGHDGNHDPSAVQPEGGPE